MVAPNTTSPSRPVQLVRLPEFCRALSISKATLHRWIASGTLQPPIHLGPRVRCWDAAYLDELVAERGPK